MFKTLFQTLVITLTLYACSSSATLGVGEPAPDFEGVDTQGVTHRLADYRGKTVVLEWTNHDCPYVRKHYSAGNMQAQQREAAAQGVVWLSIISSAPGKQGHVTPVQADELTQSRQAGPQAVILDPDGTSAAPIAPRPRRTCTSSIQRHAGLHGWHRHTPAPMPMISPRPDSTCAWPCRNWLQANPSANP